MISSPSHFADIMWIVNREDWLATVDNRGLEFSIWCLPEEYPCLAVFCNSAEQGYEGVCFIYPEHKGFMKIKGK